MLLPTRIRVARQKARMSQQDLARAVGVSRGAVANWECMDCGAPASHNLALIAKATGVNHEWLATGRGAISYTQTEFDVPAVEAEFVYALDERRLLSLYRSVKNQHRKRLLTMVEAYGSTCEVNCSTFQPWDEAEGS